MLPSTFARKAANGSRSLWGERVERDTVSHNAVIMAYEKGRQWQQALELFERMWCNATMSACEQGRHLEQALELFERMTRGTPKARKGLHKARNRLIRASKAL